MPARRTAPRREHGVIVKKKCRGCLRIALVYPSIYRAAVASLAYQNLYYMLNSFEYVVAERFVAENLYGEEPAPRSLETGGGLQSFNVILVPLSFEADYATLVRLLAAGGIALEAGKRRREGQPPVIVGGPVPSMNPAVALEVADMVLVGDAEPLVPRLVERLYEEGAWKGLDSLSCRGGFLAKNCEGRVRRVYTASIEDSFHSTLQFRIPGSGDPWGEAYMVEVSRGCRHMCRFCMPAHFSWPLRHRSYDRIVSLVEEGVEVNRVQRVAFYSLSFFDHPSSDKLLEYVAERGLTATIGSLRGDQLDEDRVELLSRIGQRVVTIAPETLSERLCRVIGKCISPDRILEVASSARRRRMHLKLYLMVGLPGERAEDVEETGNRLVELAAKEPGLRGARATVNPLIPKPLTPMQYARFIGEKEYVERVRRLKRVLGKASIRVEPLSYRYALMEAIIARGGPSSGEL